MSSRRRHNAFKHTPLEDPTKQIRLLTLHRTTEHSDISCSLNSVCLETNPFYIAVSYEWGLLDEEDLSIQVNGKYFPVRHNLWLLLSYLRNMEMATSGETLLRVFVDAVCIDQVNIPERNAQVQLMGRVYQQADSVFAWLGWATNWNPAQTFDFIRHVTGWTVSSTSNFNPFDWSEKYVRSDLTAERDRAYAAMWEMVVRLCTCEYWSRRWIVSEVLVAKKVTVLCGGQELPWATLALLFSSLDTLHREWAFQETKLDAIKSAIPFIMWLIKPKAILGKDHGRRMTLLELMDTFRSTECEVLHDRAYALLNLASNANSVKIDYSFSPEELFKQIVSSIGPGAWDTGLIDRLAKELGLGGAVSPKIDQELPQPVLIDCPGFVVAAPELVNGFKCASLSNLVEKVSVQCSHRYSHLSGQPINNNTKLGFFKKFPLHEDESARLASSGIAHSMVLATTDALTISLDRLSLTQDAGLTHGLRSVEVLHTPPAPFVFRMSISPLNDLCGGPDIQAGDVLCNLHGRLSGYMLILRQCGEQYTIVGEARCRESGSRAVTPRKPDMRLLIDVRSLLSFCATNPSLPAVLSKYEKKGTAKKGAAKKGTAKKGTAKKGTAKKGRQKKGQQKEGRKKKSN